MNCPICGSFTRYFRSNHLSCVKCDWVDPKPWTLVDPVKVPVKLCDKEES